MSATKVRRFDEWLQATGVILLIPMVFMIIIGLVFLAIFQDTVIGYGSIALGLLLGVSGFILTMKRKVYRCQKCGHTIDRA